MAKILFLIRTKSHISYLQSAIEGLVGEGHDVVLGIDSYWTERGQRKGGQRFDAFENWFEKNKNVSLSYFERWTPQKSFFWRELASYANYCARSEDYKFYRERWLSYVPGVKGWRKQFLKTRVVRWVLGNKLVRHAIAKKVDNCPLSSKIFDWLDDLKPDFVITSPGNMRQSNDVDVLRAAASLKIKTGVVILSWDNVTTKGLFHFKPDLYACWHNGQAKDLRNFHQVHQSKIRVTGAPFFDKWLSTSISADGRAKFCAKHNLDPDRRIILYLGSSANVAKDETWLTQEILKALKDSKNEDVKNAQVIFRSHPANWENKQRLEDYGVVLIPRSGELPDTDETASCFIETLSAADCVVGINTSGMVDSVILNKPVFSPMVERYATTQMKAKHFQRLIFGGAVTAAANSAKLVEMIDELFSGKDIAEVARQKFRKNFIFPMGEDATSGQFLAAEISSRLNVENTKAYLASSTADGFEEVTTNMLEIVEGIEQSIQEKQESQLYRYYLEVCEVIKNAMRDEEFVASRYWAEEVVGFDYLFEASPLVIHKIREHCYHITGERSYIYRSHHDHKSLPFKKKLALLEELDGGKLFVPEADDLGGFGHILPQGRVNVDTLKFYEVLLGLQLAGFLEGETQQRKAVLEIGSGWGGFAYQFKILRPNTTLFLLDLPPTLLFATVYLKGTFPDANSVVLTEANYQEVFENWGSYDFVFIPANLTDKFKPLQLDLAINMVSFQEMTSGQVKTYVDLLESLKCQRLYSLNRDRSPHNDELSTVTEIISTKYKPKLIRLLDVEYHSVSSKNPRILDFENLGVSQYRHIACTLKD